MSDRYYSAEPIRTSLVLLQGPEAHHLARVMRVEPGSEVDLFDGQGAEFRAIVEAVHKDRVQLRVLERRAVDRESPRPLILAVALPKGDRQRWLIEKCVELGVQQIIPLVTARGVSRPVDSAVERLRRAVIEASKQCGRNRLMQIAEPRSWAEVVAEPFGDALRLVAHPAAGASAATLDTSTASVVAAVGPEGGFGDDELELARQHRWHFVDLGPRILRIETAAVAIAAAVLLPLRINFQA
jgi:16S rRNA (uracil1498-N3)-methyltransferase